MSSGKILAAEYFFLIHTSEPSLTEAKSHSTLHSSPKAKAKKRGIHVKNYHNFIKVLLGCYF